MASKINCMSPFFADPDTRYSYTLNKKRDTIEWRALCTTVVMGTLLFAFSYSSLLATGGHTTNVAKALMTTKVFIMLTASTIGYAALRQDSIEGDKRNTLTPIVLFALAQQIAMATIAIFLCKGRISGFYASSAILITMAPLIPFLPLYLCYVARREKAHR